MHAVLNSVVVLEIGLFKMEMGGQQVGSSQENI